MVALSSLARSFALPHVLANSLSTVRSTSRRVVARAAATTTHANTEALEIAVVPCLQDNYGFLVHDPSTGATASIDTPEAAALEAALSSRGWELTHIFNTHWHTDHVGGNLALKRAFPGVLVVGPAVEQAQIPGLAQAVRGGDALEWSGPHAVTVLDVGGHTRGHVAYHLPSAGCVFVGDSLFALGCGRLFEGTPHQAWASLQRLMALDDSTAVYCAHEYTAANAAFASTIEGPAGTNTNAALADRLAAVARARALGEATVPTTIGAERATNPFVRPAAVRVALKLPADTPDAEVFAEVRRMKDSF